MFVTGAVMLPGCERVQPAGGDVAPLKKRRPAKTDRAQTGCQRRYGHRRELTDAARSLPAFHTLPQSEQRQ